MLYLFGLLVAALFILFGIDDLVWDIGSFFRSRFKKKDQIIRMADLDDTAPKLLAIIIAAWKEDAVLDAVVTNLIATAQYPRSMYHVFLGVYPNDEKTIAVAQGLEAKFPNVHMVANENAGPTCKADNINAVFRAIKTFEAGRGWVFKGFVIHDSEDVVHPLEFKMENYLLDRHDAMQFPVFPLQQMPRLKNLFPNLTVGTYADEFAENHFHTMVARNRSAAFVPSAGTGFALSRKLVEELAFENIFPEDSLTEDYKFSLTLKKRGYHLYYVLESIERLRDDGSVVREFVSTRSRFPSTFKTAVRQKTRWIYGITMQSFRFRDIFARNEMNFVQRYSLYKDWKAKFGNLMIFFGYIVFTYFIVSFFITLPVMYPKGSLSWYLCVLLTIMMFERQWMRAAAIKNIYGWKSTCIACFLPPVLPLRLVWGNIINFCATVRAWKQRFFGIGKSKSRKKRAPGRQSWDKTDHAFLEEDVLRRFHRNIGDVLLEKKLVAPKDLRSALQTAKEEGVPVGTILLTRESVTEEQLLQALAHVHHTVYAPLEKLPLPRNLMGFDRSLLYRILAYPLLEIGEILTVAISAQSPANARERLAAISGKTVEIAYSTKKEILRALYETEENTAPENTLDTEPANPGNSPQMDAEQALLALIYGQKQDRKTISVLKEMGLLSTG